MAKLNFKEKWKMRKARSKAFKTHATQAVERLRAAGGWRAVVTGTNLSQAQLNKEAETIGRASEAQAYKEAAATRNESAEKKFETYTSAKQAIGNHDSAIVLAAAKPEALGLGERAYLGTRSLARRARAVQAKYVGKKFSKLSNEASEFHTQASEAAIDVGKEILTAVPADLDAVGAGALKGTHEAIYGGSGGAGVGGAIDKAAIMAPVEYKRPGNISKQLEMTVAKVTESNNGATSAKTYVDNDQEERDKVGAYVTSWLGKRKSYGAQDDVGFAADLTGLADSAAVADYVVGKMIGGATNPLRNANAESRVAAYFSRGVTGKGAIANRVRTDLLGIKAGKITEDQLVDRYTEQIMSGLRDLAGQYAKTFGKGIKTQAKQVGKVAAGKSVRGTALRGYDAGKAFKVADVEAHTDMAAYKPILKTAVEKKLKELYKEIDS